MDKKDANILLLSDKEYEYKVLKEAGYKNVFWFKSCLRAYEYFKDHQEELIKYDVMLLGSYDLMDLSEYKYSQVFYYRINREEKRPYMRFFSSKFECEEEKKKFFISYPYYDGDGETKEEFLRALERTIPDVLRGEKLSIPDIEDKEAILPDSKEDVKILFMNYATMNREFVESLFREAGFTNFNFIESSNFSLDKSVENLSDYDLVIGDFDYNAKLVHLGDEFQDYMRDKGKNIYFVCYDYEYRKGYFLVEGIATNKPEEKNYIKFDSMDTKENVIRDIIGSIINLYARFNPSIEGGYPTEEELQEKYKRQYQEFLEEKKVIDYNYGLVIDIMKSLYKYRDYYKRGKLLGYMKSSLKSLRVDVLADGVSVAFLVKGREALRMTFKDSDNDDVNHYEPTFYLEYLNNKGNLCTPKKCVCSSSSCVNKSKLYPNDDEMKKIEGLHKKVMAEITPILDGLAHIELTNNKKDKNKKYKKEYV